MLSRRRVCATHIGRAPALSRSSREPHLIYGSWPAHRTSVRLLADRSSPEGLDDESETLISPSMIRTLVSSIVIRLKSSGGLMPSCPRSTTAARSTELCPAREEVRRPSFRFFSRRGETVALSSPPLYASSQGNCSKKGDLDSVTPDASLSESALASRPWAVTSCRTVIGRNTSTAQLSAARFSERESARARSPAAER
jgi:hypothetical protein